MNKDNIKNKYLNTTICEEFCYCIGTKTPLEQAFPSSEFEVQNFKYVTKKVKNDRRHPEHCEGSQYRFFGKTSE